jgi:alpha-beta hydrolase superfamily lysophospholipase
MKIPVQCSHYLSPPADNDRGVDRALHRASHRTRRHLISHGGRWEGLRGRLRPWPSRRRAPHGGRFQKESWRDQAQALVKDGFKALAIDLRGFGCSTGPGQSDFDNAPFEKDVLAAVHFLKQHGAKMVSVVGGSFGGGAAGDASIQSAAGDIDRIEYLGTAPNLSAEKQSNTRRCQQSGA